MLDSELQSYFTDVDDLRSLFGQLIAMRVLRKNLLVIHGVGGVGKSSLLCIFRINCGRALIPVALVSGAEQKSVAEVLKKWADDLQSNGVTLSRFYKTYRRYREIRAKVEAESRNIVEELVSTTTKTVIEAAASAIPGFGVLVGKLGGIGSEALMVWLRTFLTRVDVDLLLDPTAELTESFLWSITQVASRQRIVLLLDAVEQMVVLTDWLCDIVRRLHTNTLVIIAGRVVPDWDCRWQDWVAHSQIVEMQPMSSENMRELVHRYYAYLCGGKVGQEQVNAIIDFARGLPMVVTTAVRLWAKYGFEDFKTVKPEIVLDLVDCLLEGVPRGMVPVLEAAAVVRWFNQPILREVLGEADVREVFDDIRQFPFVRARVEGLVFHDVVRHIMMDNLRIHDPERYHSLHMRAADYFERQLRKVNGEAADQLSLERVYHRICADEEAGLKLLTVAAEEFTRYRLIGRLRTLLNDADSYPLSRPDSLAWRDYYNARLSHVTGRVSEAEEVYVRISENELLDSRLRAYSLCDLSQIWTGNSMLAQPGGVERAFLAIERIRKLAPELDSKLALNLLHLRYAYMFIGELAKALDALNQLADFYRARDDKSGIVYSLDMLKDLYGILGNWKMAFHVENEGLRTLDSMPMNAFLRTRLIGHNIWYKIWSGKLADAESGIGQALDFADREDYHEAFPGLYRDLGLVFGMQRRWKDSRQSFLISIAKSTEFGKRGSGDIYGFWGGVLSRQGDFVKAEEYLMRSLADKQEVRDSNGIPELMVWLGELFETRAKIGEDRTLDGPLTQAESFYLQCLDYRWTSRRYFECSALCGLMRVRFSQGRYAEAAEISCQAEQIANDYLYHDLLASLYSYRGHIQWNGFGKPAFGDFDAASSSYKLALLHALCHNRFMLDELLWGDACSTPTVDIVSTCALKGIEGREMLAVIDRYWRQPLDDWSLIVLSVAYPRADFHGVSLVTIEHKVRATEPGNGQRQVSVAEVLSHDLLC
ncbi:MAG: hypothetical protein JW892_04195 [Anaerolineae bacterium]|nr:hypothetical protein [Anaerolineae bacterium]